MPSIFLKYVLFSFFYEKTIPGESETQKQSRLNRKELYYDRLSIIQITVVLFIIVYRYSKNYEGFMYVLGKKKVKKGKVTTKTKDICFLHLKDQNIQC